MKRIIAAFLTLILTTGLWPASLSGPLTLHAAETADYQYGTLNLNSTYESGKLLKDTYYYTDDWFFQSPDDQNDSLALLSMQGVAAAVGNAQDGPGASFLKSLGFEEISFHGFGSSDPYDCAFTLAKKNIKKGSQSSQLIAVFVESTSLDSKVKEKSWKQNFTVNEPEGANERASNSAEQYAYSLAADKAYEEISKSVMSAQSKFWIAGQSRGGAIAGMIAARLPKDATYAYTFEAPAQVEPAKAGSYPNIHNYLCSDDLVTMIPPWGMTRYGVSHPIDLSKDISQELKMIGSGVSATDPVEKKEKAALLEEIISTLIRRVPSREEYTKKQDILGEEAGSGAEKYSYQEMFRNLMVNIMGGGFSGVDANQLLDQLGSLRPVVEALARAVSGNGDTEQKYRKATEGVYALLKKCAPNSSLGKKDIYLLLRLAGPLLVDTNPNIIEGMEDSSVVMLYLSPLIVLYGSASSITYSHHFDTLVARLKTMAPAPKLSDMALTISQPAAGDNAHKAVEELEQAISQAASPISTNTSWDGVPDKLEDDIVYYIQVEMTVPGRSLDGFSMTINGQSPVGTPEISSQDGMAVYKGKWAFTIGKPDQVTISFDSAGHGSKPNPVTMAKGTALALELKPEDPGRIHENGKQWQFAGWYKKGTDISWDQLKAEEDLILQARWKEVIEEVNISFDLPYEGTVPQDPTLPQGVLYKIKETYIMDMDYENVTKVASGEYMLRVDLISDQGVFLDQQNEDGEYEYLGRVLVNGQKPDEITYHVDEDGSVLGINYHFKPKAKETSQDQKEESGSGRSSALSVSKGYYPLRLKAAKTGKKAIKLSWKKVKKASSYVIYGSKAGGKLKKLAVTKKNTFTAKKLKKKSYYSFLIKALDTSGKTLAQSAKIFASTKGRGNAKKVTIKVKGKKKTTNTIKKGRKLPIKVTIKKTGGKMKKYKGIRYASSNPAIASISSRGIIRTRKKGKCKIYAYAQNGIAAAIKVVVK